MNDKTDFFFGDIYKKGKASISLHCLTRKLNRVSKAFSGKQINRMLEDANKELVVHSDVSYPDLEGLLERLDPEDIGLVEILSRKDVNENVNSTLYIDVYFDSGVLSIRPHWCAYKDTRAYEIITTLLQPLHNKGLSKKTFIKQRYEQGDSESKRITEHDSDELLLNLFSIAEYPISYEWLNSNESRRYIKAVSPICKETPEK